MSLLWKLGLQEQITPLKTLPTVRSEWKYFFYKLFFEFQKKIVICRCQGSMKWVFDKKFPISTIVVFLQLFVLCPKKRYYTIELASVD